MQKPVQHSVRRGNPQRKPVPQRARRGAVLLVAVTGGSGSGKSWLTERLEEQLWPNAVRVCQDAFYRDRSHLSPARRALLNFDRPEAIDWVLLEKTLRALASGRSTQVPCYDFGSHYRLRRNVRLAARPIVLVDGLWLLRRPSLRRLFKVRLFLDCPARTRLERRLKRDLASRGRARASVLRQFRATVEPMHAKYVLPQTRWADVLLDGQCDAATVRGLSEMLARQREALSKPGSSRPVPKQSRLRDVPERGRLAHVRACPCCRPSQPIPGAGTA
jgi:uridine kinase